MRSQMQYRIPFLLELVTQFWVSFMAFVTLALLLQTFQRIAGWTLWQVALLYGVVETAFGIMDMIFGGFDPGVFGRFIRLGQLDQLMLRPANLTMQVLGSEFVLRRVGRIAQGGLVLGLALVNLPVDWTAGRAGMLLIAMLSQVCFFGGLFIAGGTITFWTVESIELMNIFTYGGVELMSFPMEIYPQWIRRFFTFVIPAIFLNYYPALYVLGKPDPLGLPPATALLSPLAGVGVLALALAFWNYGLRHYQSTGT